MTCVARAVRKNAVTHCILQKTKKMNTSPPLIKTGSKLGFALAGMLALTIVSAKASAPGIYTSGPFTTSTPITSTTTDWSNSLVFPQYTPDGDDYLISVKLTFTSTLTSTLTVTNSSPSASSGTARTELMVTVQDPLNLLQPLFATPPPNYAPQLDILTNPSAYSLASGGSTTFGPLTKNGSSDDDYTLAAILTQFTGAGTISLAASTFTQTLLANTGGNTGASQVSASSLTGTVTYTYVPEPTSAVLLLGTGAMLLLRRRRA